MTGRLAGRVCVVTGAARGIGRAIAERFLAEGGRVAMLDASERRLGPAVEALGAGDQDLRAYTVDVSDRAAVRECFVAIERDFCAPVRVLVNNAVWARFQPIEDVDEHTMQHSFAVGIQAQIWTLQAALPQFRRAGGGAVVNFCSTSALRAIPSSSVYASMKAAVLGFTRAAAVELAAQGIRVNAIVPGMIGTAASIAQFDEQTLAARRAAMPMGRFGEPEEIAALAAFLASDESSYIQGAAIVADGGWTVAAN
ncbi:MAG: SDR family oxidoreductase [Burkholderiaceae bacterium]|nr:SDR family oxidoreductase [Burkholderiaceae bacterium]